MASGRSRPERSTPSPSLVIRIDRKIGSPPAALMRSRVDNVPQSTAAKLPIARFARYPRTGTAERQLFGNPTAHRVVAPGQVPGVVGMQALDATASTPDPATWPRPLPCRGERGVSLGGVIPVRAFQFGGSHGLLGCADSAGGLEPVDGEPGLLTYEPIPGGHRGAIVEDRPVADHDRATGLVRQYNLKRGARFAAQQRC